jgi:hypothetical protein
MSKRAFAWIWIGQLLCILLLVVATLWQASFIRNHMIHPTPVCLVTDDAVHRL